jgi:molecular chaperone GrpE
MIEYGKSPSSEEPAEEQALPPLKLVEHAVLPLEQALPPVLEILEQALPPLEFQEHAVLPLEFQEHAVLPLEQALPSVLEILDQALRPEEQPVQSEEQEDEEDIRQIDRENEENKESSNLLLSLPPEAPLLEPWKQEILENTHLWLEELEQNSPEEEKLSAFSLSEGEPETPDLYSFYQELCVLRNEVRRGGRRNQEVLNQFAENLSHFQENLVQIQRFQKETLNANTKEDSPPPALFLSVLDLFERMERLRQKLEEAPCTKKSFFRKTLSIDWEKTWTSFKEGFNITFSHFDRFLKKEGIVRIETVGKLFDPTVMVAIAVDTESKHPDQTVLEEITPGFLYQKKVLKIAEVKISKKIK